MPPLTVYVEDLKSSVQISDVAGLESILRRRRSDGANEFWLSLSSGEYPTIAILVLGDLADVHYLPGGGHPGFRLLGGEGLDPDGTSTFFMGFEPQAVPNRFVVPFRLALDVSRQFLVDPGRPTTLPWFEL